MGVSKAEVKLRRLLAAQSHQSNDVKLVHYVATMRDLLTELTGDPSHQDLPTIPAAKAREYAHRIELVAEKLKGRAMPDVMDTKITEIQSRPSPTLRDSGRSPQTLQSSQSSQSGPTRRVENAPGLGSPTMRRRLRGFESSIKQGGEGARVDSATHSLIQKHREIQEGLTDEMVVLSAQLKDSSMLMDLALKETEKVLDSTENAVEHSLASTNRANLRVGHLAKQSWKTSCLTWLLLFMVFGMFLFMVFLIRVT